MWSFFIGCVGGYNRPNHTGSSPYYIDLTFSSSSHPICSLFLLQPSLRETSLSAAAPLSVAAVTQNKVQEGGKLLPEFADAEEEKVYEFLKLQNWNQNGQFRVGLGLPVDFRQNRTDPNWSSFLVQVRFHEKTGALV